MSALTIQVLADVLKMIDDHLMALSH